MCGFIFDHDLYDLLVMWATSHTQLAEASQQ